ncbi:MAG: hypothetical protein MJ135_07560, partial [Oscillospiraceae bacterium]|nr:hypothetical protein [Oscillospiraceae bacterium]
AEVQHIIEQYGLVKCNGINKVTAGLAPEYGPWELRALYDSGETLYFRENGAPDGDWTAALRDYFLAVMAEAGCTDVLPPKEALTIVHFSTAFEKDGNSHHYGTITFPAESGDEKDDVVLFRHTVVDLAQQKAIQKEYAELTDELFEGLQQVIEANHMDLLHAPETVTFNLQRDPAGFLELYVDYENGRQIYCEYSAEELAEEWPAMRDALMEYLAAYMEQHPADPNRE